MHGGLGRPAPGNLSPGDYILVHYDFPVTEWHTRLLLSHVHESVWVILTPQADLYLEDINGPDITAWRCFDPHGPVPYGINAGEIHPFRNFPDDAALAQLFQEGDRHASTERARLGAPPPVNVVGPAALPGMPGAPAQPAQGRPDVAGGGGGGNAALVAALNQPGGMDADDSKIDDARTLPISRDEEGNRYKDFRTGVQECKQCEFTDWPVGGPRTAKHVVLEMVSHAGSALAHHQAWRTACKFQPSDGPAVEHEGLCKILHTMLTYDQLDISNLASAELIARGIQRIEEKHKYKLQASDESGEGALFMGAMGGARIGSVVSPKLTEWVGGELQKEALVAKERRKAREERNLARKSAGKDGDKDK